ncbi:type II secretion system F family protein, partial [Thiolapillus sp.]
WITMALCFLQVLREPVVQYLAGSEQRIAPFWNIITWYPTLDLSYFIQDYWWAILIGLAATVVVVSNLWKRSPKFRELIDRGMLKAPIFGSIMHKSALARFARTTSTMFAAGVPMVEALDSVAGATGSIVYGNAVKEMREDIATGQSLRLAMEQQPLFPHMVKQMVAIGEESGSLDDMLSKVADFYEEEVDNAVDAISSLMEPLIMVALGTLVAGLVVAMYLPIFKLGAAI